ncbi:MAG: PIG-L deacetylase family protein [Hyphomicrobium sp.]|uniref:PIG-L deacetylase family protein n=1 Tax=Hyphomicrobium sp. TaxID=82 RepID=UPI0039E5E173
MRGMTFAGEGRKLTVLCIGAHSDDIEIGVGGTILSWLRSGAEIDVTWCVASAPGVRRQEAEASARDFLDGAKSCRLELAEFKDGFFPYQGAEIKAWFEAIKARSGTPDVVFTHRRDDAHQDHREVCKLTWNTFRDHVIFEYEIPKWDGDLGHPNFYVPVEAKSLERKIELLDKHFGTQRSKDWFDAETFRGLARLRGMECRAPERYAEGFVARKLYFAAAR